MRFSPFFCHFCLMLNRKQRESLPGKSLSCPLWQKWGHMIGSKLSLVGMPGLAGNLKITYEGLPLLPLFNLLPRPN